MDELLLHRASLCYRHWLGMVFQGHSWSAIGVLGQAGGGLGFRAYIIAHPAFPLIGPDTYASPPALNESPGGSGHSLADSRDFQGINMKVCLGLLMSFALTVSLALSTLMISMSTCFFWGFLVFGSVGRNR
jgi:hypothetical protein